MASTSVDRCPALFFVGRTLQSVCIDRHNWRSFCRNLAKTCAWFASAFVRGGQECPPYALSCACQYQGYVVRLFVGADPIIHCRSYDLADLREGELAIFPDQVN